MQFLARYHSGSVSSGSVNAVLVLDYILFQNSSNIFSAAGFTVVDVVPEQYGLSTKDIIIIGIVVGVIVIIIVLAATLIIIAVVMWLVYCFTKVLHLHKDYIMSGLITKFKKWWLR